MEIWFLLLMGFSIPFSIFKRSKQQLDILEMSDEDFKKIKGKELKNLIHEKREEIDRQTQELTELRTKLEKDIQIINHNYYNGKLTNLKGEIDEESFNEKINLIIKNYENIRDFEKAILSEQMTITNLDVQNITDIDYDKFVREVKRFSNQAKRNKEIRESGQASLEDDSIGDMIDGLLDQFDQLDGSIEAKKSGNKQENLEHLYRTR
ncbi:MAG: hypothetical protein INQ03_15750 [Candidatus Heimdallarchaeota archaeon]|nr:hypothetical protein [Candidatus Heimdallarchaeota archaeon]